MKINRLVIENFKSIERIELIEPNPFTVFVGPNGSGKSNIFEALEFFTISKKVSSNELPRLFGGENNFVNRKLKPELSKHHVKTEVETDSYNLSLIGFSTDVKAQHRYNITSYGFTGKFEETIDYIQFFNHFLRLFISSKKPLRFDYQDNISLNTHATNLEQVLKRVLTEEVLRNEIFEWLELFVPGFKAVEIDERNELHWFEESTPKYFTKDLISDGTYNILALLTAVYQSDEPQFLCIEEPENGLHPQVARELVDFFRIMCEERGHYIWLNTHSQSMVSQLKPDEMIVVEKKQGATRTTQFKGRDMHGLRMDEALLMNVLGVGLAW